MGRDMIGAPLTEAWEFHFAFADIPFWAVWTRHPLRIMWGDIIRGFQLGHFGFQWVRPKAMEARMADLDRFFGGPK